jgi:hypothetical protein
MKLASKGACALMLAAAFFAGKANQASALPIHSFAAPPQDLIVQVICKYGSGKCPDNGKAAQKGPDYEKKGPQDPTVDPDCKAYGNCHTGPNGEEPAAAKKGTTAKPAKPIAIGGVKGETLVIEGVKGESADSKHKDQIHIESIKSGGGAPGNSGNSGGHSKGH